VTQAAVIDGYRLWLRLAHSTSVDPARATANLDALRERLAAVAEAGVVDAWIETLLERAANGIAVRRESSVQLVDVEAVSVTEVGATLRGCVRDGGVLYEIASGRVVDAEIRFERVTVGFVPDGAGWKFARVDAIKPVSRCGSTR